LGLSLPSAKGLGRSKYSFAVPRYRLIGTPGWNHESIVFRIERHRRIHHEIATGRFDCTLEFLDGAQQISQLTGILVGSDIHALLSEPATQLHCRRFTLFLAMRVEHLV
jgi:hypothetical protein